MDVTSGRYSFRGAPEDTSSHGPGFTVADDRAHPSSRVDNQGDAGDRAAQF